MVQRERLLVGIGLWGGVQALAIVVALTLCGSGVLPERNVLVAADSALSLGLFTLACAFVLAWSALPDAARRRCRWGLAYVAGFAYMALFAYVFELVESVCPGALGVAGVTSTVAICGAALATGRPCVRPPIGSRPSARPDRAALARPATERTMSPAMQAAAVARHVTFSDANVISASRRFGAMASARHDASPGS